MGFKPVRVQIPPPALLNILNLIFIFFIFNSIIKKITFFLIVENQFFFSEDIEVFVSIPPDIYYQKILDIKFHPEPQKILEEKWGQKIAYFKIEKLNHYEEKVIKMEIKAEFDFNGFKVFKNKEEDFNIYLSDDPYLKLESQSLKEISLKLKKKAENDFEYMKLVLDTISKVLYYNIDGKWEDAEKTLLQGHGSCSEYSFLFSSLMRIAGIPVRFIGATLERENGFDFTFHRWVEVYINNRWIPVDPQFYDTPESKGKFFPENNKLFLITTVEPGTTSYLEEWYNYKVKVKRGIIKVKAFYKW